MFEPVKISLLYFLTISSVTSSDVPKANNVQKIEVTEGRDILLTCDIDKTKSDDDLLWKSGRIVLASGNVNAFKSPRFKAEGNKFIIYNSTLRDSAVFSCSDTTKTYTVFEVAVKELVCDDADYVLNSQITYNPRTRQNSQHKYGTQAHYSCREGYKLMGHDTLVCDNPYTKWSGEKPVCKDIHLLNLEEKIEHLEQKLEKLSHETSRTQDEENNIREELKQQYGLWEYLLGEFTLYKRRNEEFYRKLHADINYLYNVNAPIKPPLGISRSAIRYSKPGPWRRLPHT